MSAVDGADHEHVDVVQVVPRAGRDGERRRQPEHQLEVHHVRGDLLRAPVDHDDVERLRPQQQAVGQRRPDAAGAACDRDPMSARRRRRTPPWTGEKSVARTKASASGAPQSRSMPESSHSIESGPW